MGTDKIQDIPNNKLNIINESRNMNIQYIEKLLQFQKDDFPELHQAAENDNIILFIGAGIAKLYGCPLWNEMANFLVKNLRKNGMLTYAEEKILLEDAITNPRKVISICYKRCVDCNKTQIYEDAIKESVKIEDANKDKANDIFNKIFSLNAITHFTTNIDDGLKNYVENSKNFGYNIDMYNCTSPNDKKRIEQVNNNIFKDGNVIYLHGNLENISECILSVDKYLSFYNENNAFLNKLFSKIKENGSIIIFIGYSLNEWDIIEKIYKIKNGPKEVIAYLLSPIFSNELIKFNLEKDYYESFGVKAIPYIIDEQGYEKINSVFDNLSRAIEKSAYSIYEILSLIEKKDDKESNKFDKISKRTVYENKFFNEIKDIKWFDELKNRGYFKPNLDTKPIESEKGFFFIPQWNVLPYLENVSQQVMHPGNEKYIEELINIIRDVTDYHVKNDKVLDNYRTWHSFLKILCNIPNDKILDDIIDLIPIWLDSKFDTYLQGVVITEKLLPKFLTETEKDIKKAEKIIEYITEIKTIPLDVELAKSVDKKEKLEFVIDSKLLAKAFKNYIDIIEIKFSFYIIENLEKKIKILLTNEVSGTGYSFYEIEEYYKDEPLVLLTCILQRILLVKAKSDIPKTTKILKKFLKDKYLYFSKMALYVIGQNMDIYSELFWKTVTTDLGESIFANTLYVGVELKNVLNNLKNLTDVQRKILYEKIENSVKRLDFKENVKKYNAFHKQEIYKALSHDSFFKNLYDEMKKITNIDVELHSAIGNVQIHVGSGPPPLTKEEIMEMSNEKLINFLEKFITKDSWNGPTAEGLAELLGEIAKENPYKFIDNIDSFINTSYLYIYHILRGIKDAWNAKKEIDLGKLLNFIEKYINRNAFWENKFILDDDGLHIRIATSKWIIGLVSEIIQDGTKNDSLAFPEKYLEQAERIIFLLLKNIKYEENNEITDYVTYTLNSHMGKTISAFIYLTLRKARVDEKKGIKSDIKWSIELKEKYEEILDKKIIEGYTCLGQYLPEFYYLDRDWSHKKIKFIENEMGTDCWEAFMTGYLYRRVYDDIYNLMRPHYQYSLDYSFKYKIYNKLVQHISISYLRNNESLYEETSLFKKMLDLFNYEQIEHIIHFFWVKKDYVIKDDETSENIREKIIEFWRWLYNRYKDKLVINDNDKNILSYLTKLTIFLPKIDEENFNWLKLSLKHCNINYDSTLFIEYLDKLKDKGDSKETSKYIGEIFLIIPNSFISDYEQKHIHSIINFLFETNNKETASKICNLYAKRGYEFLRDIYDKYVLNTIE